MKISVITPVYSETDSLYELIEGIHKVINHDLYEIILIYHYNSIPETIKIINNLEKKFPKLNSIKQNINEKGTGSAYRQGYKLASGTQYTSRATPY